MAAAGRVAPKLTDAELVTLAVMQALLASTSEFRCCGTPALTWDICSTICLPSPATTSDSARPPRCAFPSRYFWGLHLHLVCTLGGLPVGFALTGSGADIRSGSPPAAGS